MIHPLPGDYIDIHTHGSGKIPGIFAVENIMAHEERNPRDIRNQPFTYGIHPWHLTVESLDQLMENVRSVTGSPNLIAIGEAGFDKLRGPDIETQRRAFGLQVEISEVIRKPLFIHCVRAWDELLPAYKRLRPKMPWLIHGFRGNVELAMQLLSKGMYLSFWVDFVIRPESSELVRSLPIEKIFFETDGADIDIGTIYKKAAADLAMKEEDLKAGILNNYYIFFNLIR